MVYLLQDFSKSFKGKFLHEFKCDKERKQYLDFLNLFDHEILFTVDLEVYGSKKFMLEVPG